MNTRRRRWLEMLIGLLVSWVLMVGFHSLLIQFTSHLAPTAVSVNQETERPGVSKTFNAPVRVSVLRRDVFKLGEYRYDLYTEERQSQSFARYEDRYRVGIPFRAFSYHFRRGTSADGAFRSVAEGAFVVHGQYVPLVPNGLEFVIPFGGLRTNPLLYLLNTLIWSVAGYLILIMNTRIRLRIRRERQHKRMRKQGRCVRCGYQLDGLVRCPECGSVQE